MDHMSWDCGGMLMRLSVECCSWRGQKYVECGKMFSLNCAYDERAASASATESLHDILRLDGFIR